MGDMKNSIHSSKLVDCHESILHLAQNVAHNLSVSSDMNVAIVERCIEEGKRVIPMSATDKYFLYNKSLSVNWYNVILSIPTTTQRHYVNKKKIILLLACRKRDFCGFHGFL